MIRKFLAPILLIVGLVSCNFPGAPVVESTSAPVVDVQLTEPAPVGTDVSTPAPIVPIPATSIDIAGVPYTAYQIPGDPFRFVCQEPCPLNQQYIFAEYAGFRIAHALLIQVTGVDTLAELQPVDMHLVLEDSICQELPAGHAYIYSHVNQAYTCTDGPGWYPTDEEKIQMAARVDGQYFPLHEYMHTIFFGRIFGQEGDFADQKAWFMHDFVVEVPSFAIGIIDPAKFCTYSYDPAPGDYGGKLILELCQRNGFKLSDLAPSLIELDNLYQSGGGQIVQDWYQNPVPSVAQYRDILNGILGSDTTPAFAAAFWPPELFGSSYTLQTATIDPAATVTPTPVK